ncbi:MAG: cache domain-containing protein, partial [Arcobacteraceae bacterium]
MSHLTISKKFKLISLAVTFITMLLGYVILNSYKKTLVEDVYTNITSSLQNTANDRIKAKFEVGISNAISIANDHDIKRALKENNRELAINALGNLSAKMKANTPFQNIQIHVHTKDNKSFLRSWMPEKYGDDLSSFRPSVVKVNETKKAINTFESGVAGLGIRSVVPILADDGEHLGSLEFMQGINSVVKDFEKDQEGFLLLMHKSLAIGKVDEKLLLKEYIISQKAFNETFMKAVKTLDFKTLTQKKVLSTEDYTYTFVQIKDFEDKELGIAVVARPHEIVYLAIDKATNLVFIALLLLTCSLVIIFIISLINMKTNIIRPINRLKVAIDMVKESRTKSSYIEVENNDEIGEVVKSFNEYLAGIKKGMEQDNSVIDEARTVIEKVNVGLFNDVIKTEANSKEVASLISVINTMINTMSKNLLLLSQTLVELSHAKYDKEIPIIEGSTGLIASLFNGIKVTQSTMSEVMALIDNSNEKLEYSSNELLLASKKLSESSNLQAVSLEETAAAIEEIASTIKQS